MLAYNTPPSIEKVLDNDLTNKSPDAEHARKDIDAADHLLQREEERQTYFGPTARVKNGGGGSDDDDDATKQLRAAMAKIEEKKKEKENAESATTTSSLEGMGTTEKVKLEKGLEGGVDKIKGSRRLRGGMKKN